MTHNEESRIGWRLDNSYARLTKVLFAEVRPEQVRDPKLVIFNRTLAESLGLDASSIAHKNGVAVLAGNRLPKGAEPIAQAYAGHQFGYFTMLGDGRAVLIGEQIAPSGERYDIQLKGAGQTPYSRNGDGRASLGPMLREYIISEAMHSLGIPTTRSLAVVTTGELVYRQTPESGAILTRVASSHIRVGTFEFAAMYEDLSVRRALADYTIRRHFPSIQDDEKKYLKLLNEVISQQASLIAKWQCVGFVHGVMNTDNMVLCGETIDYGPCAFMDAYDLATVFSSIDREGRYAYGNQPHIAGWNLARFAETLVPLLHSNADKAIVMAQEAVSGFEKQFRTEWLAGMRAKLGLTDKQKEDETLVEDLLALMYETRSDFTNTFRALTLGNYDESSLFASEAFEAWRKKWEARLARQDESKETVQKRMRSANPAVIPRNHRVEEALSAAVENADFSVMRQLLDVLGEPYSYSDAQKEYAKLPPCAHPYVTYCGT